MAAPEHVHVDGELARFRPRGRYSLVEAVDLIGGAIAFCRDHGVGKLLVDASAVDGVPIPTLVDRFLMIEEWAVAAGGSVSVALVVRPEYIHERRFGIRLAGELGLVANVHSDEREALAWLASAAPPAAPPRVP